MLNQIWQDHKFTLGALGVAAVAAMASVVVVPETQQAVVMRLGDPVRVINKFHPGVDFGDTGAARPFNLRSAPKSSICVEYTPWLAQNTGRQI